MNPKNGGQSSVDRQRETAAEIARRKVLAAYSNVEKSSQISHGFNNVSTPESSEASAAPETAKAAAVPSKKPSHAFYKRLSLAIRRTEEANELKNQPVASYKQTPIKTDITSDRSTAENKATAEQWQKYHTAWQGYYQKYYSEYYAKAAKSYLESERLKAEREKNDAKLAGSPADIIATPQKAADPTEEEEQGIMDSLKSSIRERAEKQARIEKQKLHRFRRYLPIAAGVFVVLFILFLQYNRMIFAPLAAYVSPGNSDDIGITALDPTITTAVGSDNRLMIPKLNVDVPVNFGIANDTDTINMAMENGVAQFSIPGASAMPGEIGNLVITGHSAGDIYSNNQYKFIFSGLERLVNGDLIYIDYQETRYTYSVVKMETVEPDNVAALVYDTDKPMLTLITCTPLGTSRYRLLVTAEQINPAPSGATQSDPAIDDDAGSPYSDAMPENEPTFFERIWNWLTGGNS